MSTDINKAMKSVEKKRNLYTKQIDKEIMKLYKQVGEKYSKMLEDSSEKQRDIINAHKKYLEKEYSRISSQTEEKVKSAIERMVKDTIKRQIDTTESILEKYNIDFGKDFENMFSKVNEDAVRMLVSGKVYKDKISLSERIWGSNKKTLKEIDRIISEALIEKKHPIEIAKDIEKYVNPEVRKYTDASSYKKVKSIEYNSLRLARTYISHAYQEAAKDSSEANPFVNKIVWKSSHHKNMCGLCASRDGKKYNPKDLPLDHPNGMCSFTYETDNLEDTAERLKKWMDGEEDDELDKWYNKYIGESKDAQFKTEDINDDSLVRTKRFYDSDIATKIGKSNYDFLHDKLDSCDNKYIKKLWDAHEKNIIIANTKQKNSYHSRGYLYIDASEIQDGDEYTLPASTFFHEMGHAIDFYESSFSVNYRDKSFPQLIKEEVDEYVKKVYKELQSKADKNTKVYKSSAYYEISKEIRSLSYYEQGDISDIIEGATLCKARGLFGHGKKYWQDRTINGVKVGLAKEAFAEMFSATISNPESVKTIKKYIPKSYELFLEMIETAANKLEV